MAENSQKRVGNIVGKGEIVHLEQFLLIQKFLHKTSTADT